jgi:hypothetical protein
MKEKAKLTSLRIPPDIMEAIEQHMISDTRFRGRTDAILDLIQLGISTKIATASVIQKADKADSVIQPEEAYVSRTELQELESDLYTRLSDQLNGLLNIRLGELQA